MYQNFKFYFILVCLKSLRTFWTQFEVLGVKTQHFNQIHFCQINFGKTKLFGSATYRVCTLPRDGETCAARSHFPLPGRTARKPAVWEVPVRWMWWQWQQVRHRSRMPDCLSTQRYFTQSIKYKCKGYTLDHFTLIAAAAARTGNAASESPALLYIV